MNCKHVTTITHAYVHYKLYFTSEMANGIAHEPTIILSMDAIADKPIESDNSHCSLLLVNTIHASSNSTCRVSAVT
jgi:hypothetical protein